MATSTLGSGTLVLAGTTSGTTTVTATAVAGTTTLTLPAATDTLVGKATTDTLTNKTLTGAAMNGTLGATTPSTVAATTLTTSSTVTHNGGTANGVPYLNGSKVLTTGSALVFDGTNLGINTASPQRTLSIANGGPVVEIDPAGIGSANPIYFNYNRTTSVYTTPSYYALGHIWCVNGATEGMRLDSSGNLLVGTTSRQNATTFAVLSAGNVGEFRTSGGSCDVLSFYTSGSTLAGRINSNGSATTYVTSSDYRLKENIVPMTGALATVAQLKPCTYSWKESGVESQGFIAHELQAVVPDAVVGEKDAVNEDGSINPQGIDTSFLVATLTAAIQELKAEFDAYKASHP